MTDEEIKAAYISRFETLKNAANELKEDLNNHIYDKTKYHIDRIDTRAKDVERFFVKATKQDDNGKRKYSDPLNQIQDQIGARILVLYLDDVDRIGKAIQAYYTFFEDITKEPENDHEFKYFGRHLILTFPKEIREKYGKDKIPVAFELQIKTLFQYAWSECEHDLNYKPHGKEIDREGQRLLALASAQAWGSDKIFDELIKRSEKQ